MKRTSFVVAVAVPAILVLAVVSCVGDDPGLAGPGADAGGTVDGSASGDGSNNTGNADGSSPTNDAGEGDSASPNDAGGGGDAEPAPGGSRRSPHRVVLLPRPGAGRPGAFHGVISSRAMPTGTRHR